MESVTAIATLMTCLILFIFILKRTWNHEDTVRREFNQKTPQISIPFLELDALRHEAHPETPYAACNSDERECCFNRSHSEGVSSSNGLSSK